MVGKSSDKYPGMEEIAELPETNERGTLVDIELKWSPGGYYCKGKVAMTHRDIRRQLVKFAVPMFLIPWGTAGCSPDEPKVEVITLEGKIEKIDVTSDSAGQITVVYFNEKQKQEVSGTASINRETEILVDGAAAALRDLRAGERIRGDVRVEKTGKDRKLTVLKVVVNRGKAENRTGG